MVLKIDCRSEEFPPTASVANGYQTLSTSWDELLWSALTIGRPNRQYVFQHGQASLHEALFRLSLVRMALEQSGWGQRFKRTTAARTLDPTEKGAINYFLGLAVCKLFSARLLGAPWMIHLDVFRPLLNPVLTGRSRPDLVGQEARKAGLLGAGKEVAQDKAFRMAKKRLGFNPSAKEVWAAKAPGSGQSQIPLR